MCRFIAFAVLGKFLLLGLQMFSQSHASSWTSLTQSLAKIRFIFNSPIDPQGYIQFLSVYFLSAVQLGSFYNLIFQFRVQIHSYVISNLLLNPSSKFFKVLFHCLYFFLFCNFPLVLLIRNFS